MTRERKVSSNATSRWKTPGFDPLFRMGLDAARSIIIIGAERYGT